jgi:hypothetical protein
MINTENICSVFNNNNNNFNAIMAIVQIQLFHTNAISMLKHDPKPVLEGVAPQKSAPLGLEGPSRTMWCAGLELVALV